MHYGLAHFDAQVPGVRRRVRRAKSRWRIAPDDRERKEDLGPDSDEGRHGLGRHHHVCVVSIAEAFVRAEPARIKKHVWCDLTPGEEVSPRAADEVDWLLSLVPSTVRRHISVT
jgi:hypothetical protein